MKELLTLREEYDRRVVFESFGTRISLESSSQELLEIALERAQMALVGQIRIIDKPEKPTFDYRFGLESDEGRWYILNDHQTSSNGYSESVFFKCFDSVLRLRVAEYSTTRVFVHAGVVGWRGRGVLVPAGSHKGKTTLVAELIQNGAEYYSDDYAPLDTSGLVHPFPRDLSIRGFENGEAESFVPVEYFGGKVGREPIRIGAVVFAEYRKGAKWKPTELTIGQGIMETIPHTIPVHLDAKFSLEVLNKAYKGAIIAKSFRGDVRSASPEILEFLDKYMI